MLLRLPGDLERTKKAALDRIDLHYSGFLYDHMHSILVAIVRGETPVGLMEREEQRAKLASEIEAAISADQIKTVLARAKISFGMT